MQHRLPLSLASFILIGLWATACGEEPAPSNRAPVLTGPFVQASDVLSGTAVALSLEATDADGDPLTYEWVQTPASPAGTFSDPALPTPTWTAPQVSAATSFQLGVTVSDGKEGTVRRSVTVLVRPTPPANRAPVVTAGTPTATPSSVTGSVPIQLALSATDPDGDALTYSWTQEPATPVGSFSSNFVSSPSWISPVVTASTLFTLKVTVSDGRGGSAQAQVNITVAPPSATNRAPTLSAGPNSSDSSVNGQQSVNLSVSASDPDGDTLTYSWSQSPSSPPGTFSNASAANPSWTAPAVTVETAFQLRVIVTDGKGGSVNGTVTVTVRAPVNRPPTVSQAAQANPASATGSAPVQLSVSGTDPDGDPLTYAWTQSPSSPAGTFSNASAATTTWTSPSVSTATTFTLQVTISDGRGGTVQSQVNVSVAPPIPQNNPPVVNPPTASATTLNEQEAITLSVTATDADGDPLTYAWTQAAPASPTGTFSSTTVANPTWTAPDVTASGTYTLRVTVSDGQGGSVQGSVTLTVQKVNQPPTVAASITGPSSLLAGSTGSFSITASDPDGDPLTYSWDQTDPATQGTWVGSRTASSTSWYSPAVGAQTSFTLSVSVTDGQSTPVVRTATFPVTVPNYTTDVQAVWSAGGCTGCHGDSGGLDLSSAANLVNVPANAGCDPAAPARVVPNDPDNSVLIRKMEGSTCGDRMPRNNPGYFDNNPGLLIRVRSWILAGAPAE